MYIRLKNLPDLESLKGSFEEQNQIVLYDNIKEDLSILDQAYRIDRSSFSYGGYIILCLNPDGVADDIESLCNTYNLDKELCEFVDDVWFDSNCNIQWRKQLYLLGSDDSLMIYYPTRS